MHPDEEIAFFKNLEAQLAPEVEFTKRPSLLKRCIYPSLLGGTIFIVWSALSWFVNTGIKGPFQP